MDLSELQPFVGEVIKDHRIGKGMSQKEYAVAAGLDERTLSKLERGSVNIQDSSIGKISKFMEVSISDLKRLAIDLQVNRGTKNGVNDEPKLKVSASKVIEVVEHLLARQLPWGEWSDRRSSIESEAAERAAFRVLEGPKPNVARTLFSINSLAPFDASMSVRNSIRMARQWVVRATPNCDSC